MTEIAGLGARGIAAGAPFDTVLHLGPALAGALDGADEAFAQRLVSFGPLGAPAAAAGDGRVSQRAAAVRGKGGAAGELILLNLRDAASFRAPEGLAALYPGLRETGRVAAETLDAPTAIAEAGLGGDRNLLILGTNGDEHDVLSSLAEATLLGLFCRVAVTLPARPLYEGAADGAALAGLLGTRGFRKVGEDRSDPDRPIGIFDRDDALRAAGTRLEAQAAKARELTDALAAARAELAAARRKAEAAEEARERAVAERDEAQARADRAAEAASDDAASRIAAAREELAKVEGRLDMLRSLILREA
jgi:hypothetical protein